MKTLQAHVVVAVAVGLLAVAAPVSPQTAQAALVKTYTYAGNTFTTATGSFAGSSVTGSFTIDCMSAGASGDCSSLMFDDYLPSITSFSFSAGDVTITHLSPPVTFPPNNISFGTDSQMNITVATRWSISLATGAGLFPTESIQSRTDGPPPFPTLPPLPALDLASAGVLFPDSGSIEDSPGTWAPQTPVPIPSTLALLMSGLAALVLLAIRRNKWVPVAQGQPTH